MQRVPLPFTRMVPTVKTKSGRPLTKLTYTGSSSARLKVQVSEPRIITPAATTITSIVLEFSEHSYGCLEMFGGAHSTKESD